jgi:hypothetical protein
MPKPQPEASPPKRTTKLTLVVIGLGLAGRVARHPRTHEVLIVLAIAAAAAAALGRESGNKSMTRLKAWDAKATGKVKAVAKATVEATVDAVDAVTPGSD